MSTAANHGEVPETMPKSKHVSVLEGHALWAESYDRTENPLLTLEERIMDALLPTPTDAFVLDVACGTGRWLKKLLKLGARGGLGVDLSPEMLTQASADPTLRGKLVRGDCTFLPLPDRTADGVVCTFAMGYVDNFEAFASELARVARPGASVWISDFHPEGYKRGWRRAFRRADDVVEIRSHYRSVAEIRKRLTDAGLRVLRAVDCYLGEPERIFFERAQKHRQFQSARETPAVLIMELQHDQFNSRQSR